MEQTFQFVGKDTPGKDCRARVTRQERYTVDINLPRILRARLYVIRKGEILVRSEHTLTLSPALPFA